MSNGIEITVPGAPPVRAGACRVVAEAGANHNNSVERAIEMARAAARAGAWAVKFQLYKASHIAVVDSPKYWQDEIGTATQYDAFRLSDHLPYDSWGLVADACSDAGIVFFATPFDLDAVSALEAIDTPLYKIASGDITNRPLLEAVAQTGRPIVLSTGGSSIAEVREALDWLDLAPDKLILLACTLTYPTPDGDAHFARIDEFRREFAPYLVGFSDHTLGTAGAWMTAALGGVMIEKHYTLDKGLPDVPDHAMSVDPEELAEMVSICDRAAVMRGSASIDVIDSELPARQLARRSLVTARPLRAGELLHATDLEVKRPGTGLAPARLASVVGRALREDLPADTVLQEYMLA